MSFNTEVELHGPFVRGWYSDDGKIADDDDWINVSQICTVYKFGQHIWITLDPQRQYLVARTVDEQAAEIELHRFLSALAG